MLKFKARKMSAHLEVDEKKDKDNILDLEKVFLLVRDLKVDQILDRKIQGLIEEMKDIRHTSSQNITPPNRPDNASDESLDRQFRQDQFVNLVNDEQNNKNHENRIRRESFYEKRDNPNMLTWFQDRMPLFNTPILGDNSNITRSITPLDSRNSQIKLSVLDFQHLFTWLALMFEEQQQSKYEQIVWSSYVDISLLSQLEAINSDQAILGKKLVIRDKSMVVTNEELFELLLNVTAPKNEVEWIQNFKKLIQFGRLPPGYLVDYTKWEWMYKKTIFLIWQIKEVLTLLSASPAKNYAPPMLSNRVTGKMGLQELIWSLIPDGKNFHLSLNDVQAKQCKDVYSYLALLQKRNQELYNLSQQVENNRLSMMGNVLTPPEKSFSNQVDPKPYVNYNNKSTSDHNNNNRDKQNFTPYEYNDRNILTLMTLNC